MAKRYVGIDKGKSLDTITQGSSTTSKHVEIVIDLSVTATRQDVLVALEKLEYYITQNTSWPMA